MKIIAIALAGILILTLSACNLNSQTGGADTAEEVVNTYLRALEKKDEQTILSLIPKHLIGEQAVQAKIAKLGGIDLRFAQVCYLPLKPLIKKVTIQGEDRDTNGKEIKYKDEIYVSYFDQNWYLTIGKPKQSNPIPPTRVN